MTTAEATAQVACDTAKPYHHGDLREKLFEATENLLEEVGIEGFSLRECARRAGVSHTAPAHHFKTKSALLAAYSIRSFHGLHELMEQYMEEAGSDPWNRLKAVGHAYIDYSLRHPATYDLMHRRAAMPGELLTNDCNQIRGRGHKILEAAIIACTPPESYNLVVASAFSWVVVHGYVSLLFDGNLIAPGDDGYDEQVRCLADDLLEFMRPLFTCSNGKPNTIVK